MSQQNLETLEMWSCQGSAKCSHSYLTGAVEGGTSDTAPNAESGQGDLYHLCYNCLQYQWQLLICNRIWPLLFMAERILSTHRGPGCVTSPGPPHTASCSPPTAYSSLWDRVGSALTDCASLKCIQRPRCAQAFLASPESPVFQQHLEGKKEITITDWQCGHQMALELILAMLLLCLCHFCSTKPTFRWLLST